MTWSLRVSARVLAGLLVGVAAPALSVSAASREAPLTANVSEQYLKTAADLERATLGLPPLRFDASLSEAAKRHAALMAEHRGISHRYPDEPDLAARAATAGASFSLITENVAEAPSAPQIHVAWMNSEGHRHNLLDPNVDSVGIAVISRAGEMFAVEDFARSLPALSRREQEAGVARSLQALGVIVGAPESGVYAMCASGSGAESTNPPSFVMRYTTADLERLPEELTKRIRSGDFIKGVVAACPMDRQNGFSLYRLTVLLYRR